jgi:predicted AAA+ superfamily ATPase
MDERFLLHNSHLESPAQFPQLDPHLRQLQRQHYIFESSLLNQLPILEPGIYTLSGGRQIGKTTLLKQWMVKLIQDGVKPISIAFFSGELIDDYHSLLRLLQTQLTEMPTDQLSYFIIDEVTYIQHWDKAIKYAADAGLLENVILILTGSDLILIKEALMRFPGRRGKSSVTNFHLYPLSFRETVILKQKNSQMLNNCLQTSNPSIEMIQMLFDEFNNYLIHGGYLKAINDLALHQKILNSTLMTYSEWIRGDMLRKGKQEHYLREIITAIIKRYNSQITWNALAQDLSIDHPKTVADYLALLESIDAVFVQAALLEDKLVAAPKKARKVMFTDPFIYHALQAWIDPMADAFTQQIIPTVNDPVTHSQLAESCATTQYRRFYPTFYIKAEGEVDIAYVNKKRFWPIEIKWRNQLRPKELNQILKYPNAQILTKSLQIGAIHHIPTEPLPWALWKLGTINQFQI